MYSQATSMDELHTNFNIFGKYVDFDSWQKAELSSPVKKRKTEESSEEGEANWHKDLDDRGVDEIEDRHELNTEKEHAMGQVSFKRLVRGLEFQRTIHQLCSKECSVQRLYRWFVELYFSAEIHYEQQQINCEKTHCVMFFLC